MGKTRMKDVAYEVSDLGFEIDDKLIVTAISFALKRGETLLVTGPSGSGKSTLLKLMVRLLEPSSGTVRFFGEDYTEIHPPTLRKMAVYVPQAPALGPVSVEENLLLGSAFARKELDAGRIADLLEQVRLPVSYGKRNTRGLSGGEQYRLSLAMALSLEPQVLLLDEPTGNLDPELSAYLGTIFTNLSEKDMSLVIVTHDMELLLDLEGSFLFLDSGRITGKGLLTDVKGSGATRELWEAIRSGVVEE